METKKAEDGKEPAYDRKKISGKDSRISFFETSVEIILFPNIIS
jgi:hypothetical protein